MTKIPDYVVERVLRAVPLGCSLVPGSTPVVSFGNVETAWVATLGLNPSAREFATKDGAWLVGDHRRLVGLDLIGLDDLTAATDEQVEQVVDWCYNYFRRNPYSWFNPLESLMQTAVGASYFDGTACHLDLVQWATDPVWQHLEPPVQAQLIADDRQFLREQLRWEGIRVVLMNGKRVLDEVTAMGVPLEQAGPASHGPKSCSILVGEAEGTLFIGWSANLQSSFGMSTDFKAAIAARVREEMESARISKPAAADAVAIHLPRGSTVNSKWELATLLDTWLATSEASTLGDVGTFGGKAWLSIRLGDHELVLNSNTKREAVEAFVHQNAQEATWHVIANARGTVNKVVYTLTEDLPGWYCYLTRPWTTPGTL